jgi:hypothetical protein
MQCVTMCLINVMLPLARKHVNTMKSEKVCMYVCMYVRMYFFIYYSMLHYK